MEKFTQHKRSKLFTALLSIMTFMSFLFPLKNIYSLNKPTQPTPIEEACKPNDSFTNLFEEFFPDKIANKGDFSELEKISKSDYKMAYNKSVLKYHPDKNFDKNEEELAVLKDKFGKITSCHQYIYADFEKNFPDYLRLFKEVKSPKEKTSQQKSQTPPTTTKANFHQENKSPEYSYQSEKHSKNENRSKSESKSENRYEFEFQPHFFKSDRFQYNENYMKLPRIFVFSNYSFLRPQNLWRQERFYQSPYSQFRFERVSPAPKSTNFIQKNKKMFSNPFFNEKTNNNSFRRTPFFYSENDYEDYEVYEKDDYYSHSSYCNCRKNQAQNSFQNNNDIFLSIFQKLKYMSQQNSRYYH
jgi:hypothetical protein